MSTETQVFLILLLAAGAVTLVLWDLRRKKKRRESLKREADGTYTWIGLDGCEKRSREDPSERGGLWDSEGGGGDGGGDGGGGGGD
ncbi:MAG: hypothetical protein AAF943_04520 [Pseudomonadota bacterium]